VRVQAAHPEDYEWIASRATLAVGPLFRAIKAVDEKGNIHGMVGFDGWTPNSVSLHLALDNPLALRSLLKPGFGIAFDEFYRGVIVVTVLSDNARSLALIPKLGFREVHRIRDGWKPGIDMVLFEMRREDCRWVGPVPLRKAG